MKLGGALAKASTSGRGEIKVVMGRARAEGRSASSPGEWFVDSPAVGTGLLPSRCGDDRRPAKPAASADPFAVTFSGGGFRATLASLGVVRLLADIGRLSEVRYLSSVSGGSVANGVVAVAWPALRQRGFTPAAVDELVIDPVVRRVSKKSLKWSLVRGLWRTVGPRTRTDLLARRFDEWFFDRIELEALDQQVRWIVNAANLTSGARFTFERDVVGDYTIGLVPAAASGLRLSLAVAASAAVPGAFPPLRLPDLDFPCGTEAPALLDGGAYDNTGLEAIDGESYRDAFIVTLNAGGLLRPGTYGRIPLVRELARANSLLYRQSTALRTRSMVERFERAGALAPGDPVPEEHDGACSRPWPPASPTRGRRPWRPGAPPTPSSGSTTAPIWPSCPPCSTAWTSASAGPSCATAGG